MLNVSWKERPGLHRSNSTKPVFQKKELNENLLSTVKIKSTRHNITKSFPEKKIQQKNCRVFSCKNTYTRQTTKNQDEQNM